ncbi:J domain-containing protein [Vibrio sp. Isolate25]|uniref:J domain-containing protein n=1 Tax=Vibrio sp. Isolate25 TaxID=2908535 RepID=UPI001EFC9394|nr:J domain-containing protein [Vibrio sp. Isolate25]MCG9597306.1 J domain-containing protein [Vibrio sp. Isolate25]
MKFISLLLLMLSPITLAESIEVLTNKAQSNDVEAQIQLANQYLNGEDVQPSQEDALYWLEQAANNGSTEAAVQLASLYLQNETKDTQEAIYWLTKLAVSGNTQAQFNLGKVYENMPDSPENLDLAEVWYRTASSANEEAEQAYARVLEKKFNAQRAKQVSSIGQLDVAFDNSTIELSPVAKSKSRASNRSNDIIYALMIISGALSVLAFWLGRKVRKLKAYSKLSHDDLSGEKRKLESKLKDKDNLLRQQKKQLETLYRQFKKMQSSQAQHIPKHKSDTLVTEQKLSLACALFGFKVEAIPAEKDIKVRYKQLCKIYHPDLKGSDEEMKRLNNALKVILANVNR